MKYKYVTPHWEDYQDKIIDEETNKTHDTYTMTHLSILNNHPTEAAVTMHFYDAFGVEFTDMAIVDLALPSNAVWSPRVYDIIVKENKNYATLKHGRKGWMSIVSTNRLAVSGKIIASRKPFNNDLMEYSYSIPFFETQLENAGKLYEPIDPGNDPIDPIGRKIPKPFPR